MNIEIIGFPIFFIAILLCFYYYDRILKTEYFEYRERKEGHMFMLINA